MECYAAMRMNYLHLQVTIWINLTNIQLSENSQYKRVQTVWLHLYVVQQHAKLNYALDITAVVTLGMVGNVKRAWVEDM